MQFELIDS
jgi:hypothetical protein